MRSVEAVKLILKDIEPILRRQYHVKSLSIFGSVARGEATAASDIDFLVEFSAPVGLIEFMSLQNFLEDTLHANIDIATKNALRPEMKETILKEAIRVA